MGNCRQQEGGNGVESSRCAGNLIRYHLRQSNLVPCRSTSRPLDVLTLNLSIKTPTSTRTTDNTANGILSMRALGHVVVALIF